MPEVLLILKQFFDAAKGHYEIHRTNSGAFLTFNEAGSNMLMLSQGDAYIGTRKTKEAIVILPAATRNNLYMMLMF